MYRQLLEIGLSNALAATVLAVAVAIISRVVRRPALIHSLWVLVLLKLVMPPLWTVPVGWPSAEEPAPVAATEPAPEVEPIDESTDSPALESAEAAPVVERTLPEPVSVATVPAPVPVPDAPSWSIGWRPVLGGIWLVGSVVWLATAAARIGRFRRVLRFAMPAPLELRQRTEDLAQRLGLARVPGVWVVPGAVAPMVWTLGGKARLLVPEGLWARLDDDQRAALLIHELAHLRRRDHWVRLLELVVTALYWWHPVVWWARRSLREAEEQCCDAWVLWADPDSSRTYATALLEAVDFLSEARPALPPAASGMGQVRHLSRRIAMIMKGKTPRMLSWVGLCVVLGLGALMLPWLPTWAGRATAIRPSRSRGP